MVAPPKNIGANNHHSSTAAPAEVPVEGLETVLSSSLTVDSSLPLPQMTPHVVELCKDLFKKWSGLDDSSFTVETISGGITNLLLKVSVEEASGNEVCVTVRVYGPNTDNVINREREQVVILLNTFLLRDLGPSCLEYFQMEWCNLIYARTLTPEDMRKPKLAAEIAKQLRKFHAVEIPGSEEPQLWNEIFLFYENASKLQFDVIEKQRKYDTILFKEVYDEVVELKELTDSLNSPVVFSHNDLLSGNLMVNEDEDKLYLIDFEYASYSYRGFDIGNHFAEYAGYDCDYSLYPNKDEQYHFFRHYLQPDKPNEASDAELEALCVEANTYMLASHLFWSLWALIQGKMSPIDFDYLNYFFMRYNEYKSKKETCCSLARSYLSKTGRA